ncbi:MAG: aminodeoxychorismate/anthranilate synthase component II [Bacteroidetes bacterium]|nr:aminodeoxychorismate/anthranilate synthase component II [Bacteroidota bacterium]NOR34497.1 aminodeoxychorismate/anthranilate synthase component II [Bacteroidales bacterium]
MKILVLDNYDSFTYNLVQYIERVLKRAIDVKRNDQISLEELAIYDKILISPGPGIPSEAGICLDLIKEYGPSKSILGVCLGHQAIAEAYGGSITNLSTVYHGVTGQMKQLLDDEYLFSGVPTEFDAGRYHSWVVEHDTLPRDLEITVENDEGYIMAIRHREHDVRGVQFHPESVLTEYGGMMILNWINRKS